MKYNLLDNRNYNTGQSNDESELWSDCDPDADLISLCQNWHNLQVEMETIDGAIDDIEMEIPKVPTLDSIAAENNIAILRPSRITRMECLAPALIDYQIEKRRIQSSSTLRGLKTKSWKLGLDANVIGEKIVEMPAQTTSGLIEKLRVAEEGGCSEFRVTRIV